MRRLPVYFVLDCSDSMAGESLTKMEQGLQQVVKALRADPHALESVYISVIAFAGMAKTIAPLTEVASFYAPKLPLGEGTGLGNALSLLMDEIDRNVVKTTPEQKGDWKPIVYLFTDGRPTDKPFSAVKRWSAAYSTKATMIAISLGKNSDFTILKQLTPHVLIFEEAREGDFKKFVSWISASVAVQSKSVGEAREQPGKLILDESVMYLVKEAPPASDDACVTLVGRCQKTRKPYLIKYDRDIQVAETRDFKVNVSRYLLAGCFPLEEEYFAWSQKSAQSQEISTSELMGAPGCPHCGNATAFAMCGCGQLLCINGPGEVTCPWCAASVSFREGGGSDEGFNVSRGQG